MKIRFFTKLILPVILLAGLLASCKKDDPEVIAGFTYKADANNFLKIDFTSTAQNFTSLTWDFGDGKMAAGEGDGPGKPSGPRSGTVELAYEQMRLIMGGTAGKGVLHFKGADYPFTFKTASAGIGAKAVTSVSATGDVYALERVEDFAGKYTSISRSAMAGSREVTASFIPTTRASSSTCAAPSRAWDSASAEASRRSS